jgi:uncharacterized Zn finger protein
MNNIKATQEEIKQVVDKVLEILNKSDYFDPAEHLYDGIKQIKKEITENTLHNFLWALESPNVTDWDGKLKECIEMIKSLYKVKQNENE